MAQPAIPLRADDTLVIAAALRFWNDEFAAHDRAAIEPYFGGTLPPSTIEPAELLRRVERLLIRTAAIELDERSEGRFRLLDDDTRSGATLGPDERIVSVVYLREFDHSGPFAA